jgi:hypothetical protein
MFTYTQCALLLFVYPGVAVEGCDATVLNSITDAGYPLLFFLIAIAASGFVMVFFSQHYLRFVA